MKPRSIARSAWMLPALIAALVWSPAAAAKPADTVIYQVKRGDTLSGLAFAFLLGTRWVGAVAQVNGIRDPDLIFTHRRLRIPRRLLRDERTRARIQAFSGEVEVLRAQGAAAAGVGQELDEATTIATGRNSFLTLRLTDGSAITIPSQTTFRILRLRRVLLTGTVEREFALEKGRARIRVTPMPSDDSTFRVRTPVSHAAVRGTVFRAAYDAETGVSSTEVDEGKVAVTAPGGGHERLLQPAFGIALGRSVDSGAQPLLDAPRLVDPGQMQSGRDLQFAVEPLAGAKIYRIEIARDAGILDPVTESVTEAPTFTLPSLPAGGYFARLAAVDANGLEGAGRVYAFQRRRNGIVGTLLQSGAGRKARYLFKWEAETDGTPLFRFQLKRVSDNAHMVDELALRDREILVSALPPGEYAWRVLSTLFDDGKPLESWSAEQRFTVARRR